MSMTPASQTYFQANAAQWDRLRSAYFTEAVRKSAIRKAYLRPEMVVGDVGGGTGFLTAGLAPLVRQVHLLDGSPEMLDVARKNLAAFSNVVYQQADGLSLPLPDASLDAVFANMYLHHVPDPQAAIGELVRVLRPGGRLVITDMDAHSHEWMRAEMADVWLGFERAQVRAWLEAAGLVNLIVDGTGESCCAKSEVQQADGCSEAEISVFLAVGTRSIAGVKDAVQANYRAEAEGRGGCCSSPAEPAGLIQLDEIEEAPQAAPAASGCCGAAVDSQAIQEAALAASACCGSVSAVALAEAPAASEATVTLGEVPFYTPAEKAQAPAEAAEFSLGCGNPTALAGMKPGETVLDIGSGGGFDSFLAARQVGPTGKVIGVDMTPAMLARARRTAEKAGLDWVEFREGQAEALPVEDDTVDVVLSNCVINLSSDKGRVFREAFRVLKPGGRLEVSDVTTTGAFPLDLFTDLKSWAGCVYGALPETEYLDLVRQAGFENVRVRRSPGGEAGGGVQAYSLLVQAVKPPARQN